LAARAEGERKRNPPNTAGYAAMSACGRRPL